LSTLQPHNQSGDGLLDRDPNYCRSDKHESFLQIADIVSTRSHDSQTQHGCVFVKNGRIISTGFNGFIADGDDKNWCNKRPSKYLYIIHSEMNAIINAAKEGVSIEGSTAYITGQPCLECTKALIQAGVKDWVIGDRGHVSTDAHVSLAEYFINFYDVRIKRMELKEIK
jgi:dCMP deaminase